MQSRTEKTREKLILSGIELYAHNGIEGVSLRAVNEHANSKNNSAAHYHFKTKDKFIEHIIAYMFDIDKEELDHFIDKYSDYFKGIELSIFKFTASLLFVYEKRPWGVHGLQFLSMLVISSQMQKSKLWSPEMMEGADSFIDEISSYAPGVNPAKLRLRSTYMLINMIIGMASDKAIGNTVFGDLSDFTGEQQYRALVSYCAAGIIGSSTSNLVPN